MYNDVESAKLAIGSFLGSYTSEAASQKKVRDEFNTSTQQLAYKQLGTAYGVATRLLASPDILTEVLTDAGIAVAGDGENQFSPIIRLLYRVPVRGGGTKANKSAWKYGSVLRYAHDNEWTENNFSDKLNALELEIDGSKKRKLLAAELADRAKYRADDIEGALLEQAFVHALDQPGIGQVPGSAIPLEGRETGSWVTIAAVFDAAKGQYILHHVVSTSSAAVKKSISDVVAKTFKDDTDALFRDLAVHNREMDQLNAKSALAQVVSNAVSESGKKVFAAKAAKTKATADVQAA